MNKIADIGKYLMIADIDDKYLEEKTNSRQRSGQF